MRADTLSSMKPAWVLVGLLTFAGSSWAQGLINFINYSLHNQVEGLVTRADGTRLAGADVLGQLYVAVPGGSLQPVGKPEPFREFPAGVGTGVVSGYTVAVPFILPGNQADVVLRAWSTASGATWETAAGREGSELGESNTITIELGGQIYPPAFLSGLQPTLMRAAVHPIPEPRMLALMAMGWFVLLSRRYGFRSISQLLFTKEIARAGLERRRIVRRWPI